MEWLKIEDNRKRLIFTQVANNMGIPAHAVEKDWWVTLTLKAIFELPISENLVFKGGTSLSKGWNLIDRFSEDIDLAIDRSFFGFEGDLSGSQIRKLRKKSCKYVSEQLKNDLHQKFIALGFDTKGFSLKEYVTNNSDTDPQTLELDYTPLFNDYEYVLPRVLIEVGSRSLIEPAESISLQSLMGQNYNTASFADQPFPALCVNPQRTFIEKVLLLHEAFLKESDNVKLDRMSRHLYDIHRIMDTDFGLDAVKNTELFQTIVKHRERYTPLKGIDYAFHTPKTINIIPPKQALSAWKEDYQTMKSKMIYDVDTPTFEGLLSRMEELKGRFSEMPF
jgi:Nucleotidyl transferase AbiEii toxin, Type IV TA system